MSAFALGSFGVPPPAARQALAGAGPASARAPVDPRGEARLALTLLAAAGAGVYAVAAATVIARQPQVGAPLLAIAALEAAWPIALRRRPAAASSVAVVLNALLVGLWIFAQTAGPPIGDGAPAPLELLPTLTAASSTLVVVLVLAHRAPLGGRLVRASAGLRQLAVVLAIASLATLAGGHTHAQAAVTPATPAAPHLFYCSLV